MPVDRVRALSALLDDALSDDEETLALLRPVALHAEDVEMAAPARGHEFACVECQAHAAEVFCEQCHDYFCDLCFGGQHRKGNRRAHTTQPVVAAVQEDQQMDSADKLDADEDTAPGTSDDDSEASEEEDDEDEDDSDASEHGVFAQPRLLLTHEPPAPSAASVRREGDGSVLERAKFIPLRLTYEERKLLRTLEAALSVSPYTDKLDAPAYMAPAKRLRAQLQEVCGFLSGILLALDYRAGQEMLDSKNFVDHARLFQEIFELGRRYKIMNPEKMRGEYGKLMYLVQDAVSPAIQELLGFSCHTKIKTVYDVLAAGGGLAVLRDAKIETATMVVAPENRSRHQIRLLIQQKESAIRTISERYATGSLSRDTIQQCLYSIADNNYHLYFERDPIDRMVTLLQQHFDPESDTGATLAIVSGQDGARLSHSHARQFHYVLQSLTLWREVAHDMFRLWCLTDDDLLDAATSYSLSDTGQGLHRVQPSPRVSRAMHVLLHTTQRSLGHWVGSSVIHLGDKNVPNALMFIDKYTQVGHILRPIVKTVDALPKLVQDHDKLKSYVDHTYGGAASLQREILADFFREAFDGSGADNFFEAGSCIDGRLTSAWNWCSRLHEKRFYPVFKLAGFVGFDGKFG